MARPLFLLLACAFALLSSSASADVVEQTFIVGNLTIERLCQNQVITAVNGILPGPIIEVNEGDTVIILVSNQSPYGITIHWHGLFQIQSQWADGPEYITQCPIMPGNNYTYMFNVTNQEGTLWWHTHVSWLRATVYGALIIHPRAGNSYPFDQPYAEVPILLGEWWNANVMDVIAEATESGGGPNISDAFTINGQPGALYPCSENQTYTLTVVPGMTYLLRIINAALNYQLFFKIADHNLTVVGIDASYTTPYNTDVVMIAPGQTTDVLLTANQTVGMYYMAARAYISTTGVPFDGTTTTGILQYEGATMTPQMPVLPAYNDTATAFQFSSSLTSLQGARQWVYNPEYCDEEMFVTNGLGLTPCDDTNTTCAGPFGYRLSASMNNVSFQLPSTMSLLEALFFNVSGIFTADFPDEPPVVFDYTNTDLSFSIPLALTVKGTRVKLLRYNTTVQVVLQNTAFITTESHPIHLHSFNFFVVGQGFGNYDNNTDPSNFNLVNPQQRNTLAIPVGGWAVIRFTANNPGIWFFHCHLDVHFSWGFATAFVVGNGDTPSSILPPPPLDFPQC